jgi:type I restriction enzyme S subunit
MSTVTSMTRLEDLMATRQETVDPSVHPTEVFELFSIPAYDSQEPEVVDGSAIGSTKKSVEPGDVLLSRIVPHIRRAWVVPQANGHRQIASGEWIVFRSKKFNPSYLRHLLMSDVFHAQFMNTVAGVGGSLLRARPAFVAEIEIPLPPLPEQKRIADILDKADAIRQKRREANNLCGRIPTGLFFEMFGDPHVNPHDWPTKQLKELVVADDKINYGVVQPGVDFPGGVPIVRVGDLQNLRVSIEDLKRIDPLIEKDYARSRLVGDEVLVACVGSIGLIALADQRVRGFNIVRAVARIRCSDAIDRLYLAAYLATPAIQNYFYRATRTVSQPTLNIKQIEETPVHVPPLEMQRQFAIAITRQQECLQRLESATTEVNQLFSSLVQRAFRGEL